MALTGSHIRNALSKVGAVGGQMRSFDQLAAGANDALRRAPAGLTVAGAAAFLATMAQESAYFRTTTEYSAGRNRYSPYDGRTFEMVTWETNYRAFGVWCKSKGRVTDSEVFVKNPTALADYKYAWDGGVWYFDHAGLWKYANAGNFLAVSQGVNGGTGTIGSTWKPAGWNARNSMYAAFKVLGSVILPGGTTPSVPDTTHADTGQDLNKHMSRLRVKQLQEDTLGFKGSDVDGIAGPKTIKALEVHAGYKAVADGVLPVKGSAVVRKMQYTLIVSEATKAVGLEVDGILGPKTDAQIEKYMHLGGRFTNLSKMETKAPKAEPKPTPRPTLRKGSSGKAVSTVQAFLMKQFPAYSGPIKTSGGADGRYGDGTAKVVAEFQKRSGIASDGIIGADTWNKLKKEGLKI